MSNQTELSFNVTDFNKEHFKVIGKKLSNIVKATLGPMGKNVIISNESGLRPTKDGITVLENVRPTNDTEAAMIGALIKSSRNLAKTSGDGTTTALMFLTELLGRVIDIMEEHKLPTFVYENLLGEISNTVSKVIVDNSLTISDLSQLMSISRVSINNNMVLLNLMGQAFNETLVKRGMAFDDVHLDFSPSITGEHSVDYKKGYVISNKTKITVPNRTTKFKSRVFLSGSQFTDPKVANSIVKLMDDFNDSPAHQDEILILMSSEILPNVIRYVTKHIHENYITKGKMNRVILNTFDAIGVPFDDAFSDIKAVLQNELDYELHEGTNYDNFDFNTLPVTNVHIEQTQIVIEPVLITDEDGRQHNELMDTVLADIEDKLKNPSLPPQLFKGLTNRKRMMGKAVCTIFVGGDTDIDKAKNMSQLEDATKAVNSAVKHGYNAGACSAIIKSHGKLKDDKMPMSTLRMLADMSEYGVDREELGIVCVELLNAMRDSAYGVIDAILNNAGSSIGEVESLRNIVGATPWDTTYDVIVGGPSEHILNPTTTDLQIVQSSISLIRTLVTSDTIVHENEMKAFSYAGKVNEAINPITL